MPDRRGLQEQAVDDQEAITGGRPEPQHVAVPYRWQDLAAGQEPPRFGGGQAGSDEHVVGSHGRGNQAMMMMLFEQAADTASRSASMSSLMSTTGVAAACRT